MVKHHYMVQDAIEHGLAAAAAAVAGADVKPPAQQQMANGYGPQGKPGQQRGAGMAPGVVCS